MLDRDQVQKLLVSVKELKGGYYKGYRDALCDVLEVPKDEQKDV